jgi:hypothetical protein
VTGLANALLFCWSIYRRIWQVQRIELIAPSTLLSSSSVIGYDVVTSGEVQNLIRLELVQGDRHEILLEQRADHNRISGYDPRLFRYTPKITIGAEHIARLHTGPATLRLTVFGGQKLLHVPPPRVREVQVTLSPATSSRENALYSR